MKFQLYIQDDRNETHYHAHFHSKMHFLFFVAEIKNVDEIKEFEKNMKNFSLL